MRIPTHTIDARALLGAPAPVIYRELILAHDGATAVWVRAYSNTPSVQARLAEPRSRQLVDVAMAYRGDAELPFWHAMMRVIERSGKIPHELLDAALFHQGPGLSTHLSRRQLSDGELATFSKLHRYASLDSWLAFDDQRGYLPLLDFRISPNEAHTKLVSALCQRLLPQGFVILDSGRSYHACGVVVHTKRERVDFLAKSLLFAPIVDDRYVAHQILQPSSTLRISGGDTGQRAPTVVSIWYPEMQQ